MKAIIPAAGYGTRFLPATKVVPKELLPVGAKPAIQWIVEEALAAGADEVVIVTSPDKPALRRHFSVEPIWHERLRNKPEIDAAISHVEALSRKIRFVDQMEQRGLGHAVLQAASLFKGTSEPILILLGDALVNSPVPCAQEMVSVARQIAPDASWVGVERVPRDQVYRYGVVAGTHLPENDRVLRLTGLVEKPAVADAPSDLVIAGRYLLQPAIFTWLQSQKPGTGGEIQLTDAILRSMADTPVYAYRYPGKRHDIGRPEGYLKTLNEWGCVEG